MGTTWFDHLYEYSRIHHQYCTHRIWGAGGLLSKTTKCSEPSTDKIRKAPNSYRTLSASSPTAEPVCQRGKLPVYFPHWVQKWDISSLQFQSLNSNGETERPACSNRKLAQFFLEFYREGCILALVSILQSLGKTNPSSFIAKQTQPLNTDTFIHFFNSFHNLFTGNKTKYLKYKLRSYHLPIAYK